MVTPKSTLTLREAAAVVAICFGLFILSSIEASAAGFPEAKFTDDSTGWTIAIELARATRGRSASSGWGRPD